jgi:hypothetical protein
VSKRHFYAQIERAASDALAAMARVSTVELGLARDDHEARDLGWPCVGAHAAMLGLVAVRATVPVEIVPCGSTVQTAGAANQAAKGVSVSAATAPAIHGR